MLLFTAFLFNLLLHKRCYCKVFCSSVRGLSLHIVAHCAYANTWLLGGGGVVVGLLHICLYFYLHLCKYPNLCLFSLISFVKRPFMKLKPCANTIQFLPLLHARISKWRSNIYITYFSWWPTSHTLLMRHASPVVCFWCRCYLLHDKAMISILI